MMAGLILSLVHNICNIRFDMRIVRNIKRVMEINRIQDVIAVYLQTVIMHRLVEIFPSRVDVSHVHHFFPSEDEIIFS